MKKPNLSRREFLEVTALSIGSLGVGASAASQSSGGKSVCVVTDRTDAVASAAPVAWAVQVLGRSLARHGIAARNSQSIDPADLCIVAAGSQAPLASRILKKANVPVSNAPESLGLVPGNHEGSPVLLACGSDARGLMYAVLELADQFSQHDGNGSDLIQTLGKREAVAEQPFNTVRSIGRLFVSDVEDKPWFNDREMWPAYFAMLAEQRFNRFQLALGIGYDFLRGVTDAYFLFAYPFFLAVPRDIVRAVNLPDAERDRNLETLRFISEQAVAHGIDFQLGIWTHGYEWIDSPHANYTIEGLNQKNHAAYSRDALAALLQACPKISGVTLRTHGESGVHEGSYEFWKTVFDGVSRSGRKVEIDLHTKGLDQKMLDATLSTGMPVKLSPKYWAEHLGMPYHQTAIRELEMPQENANREGFFGLSSGSRSFTRYGYADFLTKDRPYTLMHRVWPGTTRFLLTGDPVTAAAHSRAFRFCGSSGGEFFEPLSFKGRRGSGIAGGRCAYADASLQPRWDWEKYLYTYRVWGRHLYNPEADPDTWRRYLRKQFQGDALALESALASATRILPIVTTAHLPSAANESFHPEFYTNQPMVEASKSNVYGDTPAPKVFGNVSALDPQIFSRMSDFAGELLKGERSGKYSPVEVAQWLEDFAENAAARLQEAEGDGHGEARTTRKSSPEFRRMAVDLKILIGLGRFFEAKFRAGTLYAIHEQSGDRAALVEALKAYRRARKVWAQFAEEAKGVYVADITIGTMPHQRGQWLERLPAIDADIAEMAKRLDSSQGEGLPEGVGGSQPSARVRSAIQEVLGRPRSRSAACVHTPPARFVPGEPLEISLSTETNEMDEALSIHLYYRHATQAERFKIVEMHVADMHVGGTQRKNGVFRETISGTYTASDYPLQYYFEVKQGPEWASLYPGFTAELTGQPYFVLRAL
jgi:hypothetical protein